MVDASLGYRRQHYDLELIGIKLMDRRERASLSESDQGQFYRRPMRKLLRPFDVEL